MSSKKSPKTDLSLRECCGELSISYATGKNWVRLGKLTPDGVRAGAPFFRADTVRKLREELTLGKNPALKSRRNKRYVSGVRVPESYVAADSPNTEMLKTWLAGELPADIRIRQILADSAGILAAQWAEERAAGPRTRALMKQLISELRGEYSGPPVSPTVPPWYYIDGEDTLGLIYLSLLRLSARKNAGTYYTPEIVAKQLIGDVFSGDELSGDGLSEDGLSGDRSLVQVGEAGSESSFGVSGFGTILDPCCGSGTFLMHLPREIPLNCVYGLDLDPVAIAITRINLAMRTGTEDGELLHTHFQVRDFLRDMPDTPVSSADPASRMDCAENGSFREDLAGTGSSRNDRFANRRSDDTFPLSFDRILGNPPWGSHFPKEEKEALRGRFACAAGAVESSDLFAEQALRHLAPDGELAFVLPEAMLTVSNHRGIRRLLRTGGRIRHLDLLGEAFDAVQCPSMILHFALDEEDYSSVGTKVRVCGAKEFVIMENQSLGEDELLLPIPDEDYRILRRLAEMPGAVTLRGHADFALGLVTGDNRRYVREITKHGDDSALWRPVLRGSDLFPYVFRAPSRELDFRPELFQQVADLTFYRAPEKLIYRFIGSGLVVSYDDHQTLTLNSANILIPRLPGYSVKTVLALLNSAPSRFWFCRRFRSVKVLRSHLESIPLPPVDSQTGQEIDTLVDEVLAADFRSEKQDEAIHKLQDVIRKLYPLTKEEYRRIEI